MKTDYEHIKFKYNKKNKTWLIHYNGDKTPVGGVYYIQAVQQWIFYPCKETGWTMQYLTDIVDFVKQLNESK